LSCGDVVTCERLAALWSYLYLRFKNRKRSFSCVRALPGK
jgi:hypothetical protein